MVQSHNSGATKKTVLVVDDSTTMRSMVQSFLSQEEYHVQVAKSGQEGLTRIQEHCPDILLLDFIMPGMNGYEVYIRLREQPEYADLPIVIMSGSKVEVFNKFAESKAEQKFVFLSKPFDPEILKKQISLALELRLIPTALEDISGREEIHLEPPVLSDEPAFVEEATAAVQEETVEDVAVSPEVLPTDEDIVPDAVAPPSEVSLEMEPLEQEAVVLYPSHDLAEMPIAEVQIPTEAMLMDNLPVEGALMDLDKIEPSLPSYEPAEIPMAQIPLENSNFDHFQFQPLPEALNLEHETMHSAGQESAEQIPIEAHPEVHLEVHQAEPSHIELNHEEPAEKILVAQTSEETAAVSKPQVSTENMSLEHIHQNLAHILETENYVMSALQNLDERTAEDIHSIRSLADDTNRLQQEFMYVREVLNDLTELPKQLETLKEQVLSQPQVAQVYLDKTEQEHLTLVGDRFNSVDAVLMQSVVTLDRLEEIQAGLGETIHTSYGQLSDRLTVIERRFEAIIVRPPDPVPITVVSSPSKRNIPPLLYITIALGALNFGAMVALLMR
jgi:twitching motility two-component system response regulator PilH